MANKFNKRLPIFFLLFVKVIVATSVFANDTRLPAVAGQFYPDDKVTLEAEITKLLREASLERINDSNIYGFIVPHAGYKYSGKTAAYAYKALQTIPAKTIILIGPYHKARFAGASIWDKGSWESPLGKTEIDQELARKIKQSSDRFQVENTLHMNEHSLEVELPFIQVVAPSAKIVPILISDPSYSKDLAKAIYDNTKDNNIIVIASSDLSHYHPDIKAREIDQRTIQAIENGDPEAFSKELEQGTIQLCGGAAVLTMLHLAKLRYPSHIEILDYSNSGEATNDLTRVVGYVSAAVKTEPRKSN